MLDQMKLQAVDAVGNADRRVADLHSSLRLCVERKFAISDPRGKAAELKKFVGGTKITVDLFLSMLEGLGVAGLVDDKIALFERFDADGSGCIDSEEFAEGVFGLRKVPLTNHECRTALQKLRAKVLRRSSSNNGGEPSMRNFSRTIRIMDRSGDGSLSQAELKSGIQRYGIDVTEKEAADLFAQLDRDGNGRVSITEFLRGVRGRMNTRRRALVKEAYAALDKNGDEAVTLAELSRIYDVSRHPSVLSKERLAADVLRDFASAWDKNGDGVVTLAEFMDYYDDVSAGIDHDDAFELMIRNVWHISGGEGWCANTTCRRVVVTLEGGNQVVRELPNDIGVSYKGGVDIAAVKKATGMKEEIVKVDLFM